MGVVEARENVRIVESNIEGSQPTTILVQARGPVLANSGVPGELPDPLLPLFSGQTTVTRIDIW